MLKFYGNQSALQTLTSAVQGGRLCHAYLIEGSDGTGKTAFAMRFAAAILCRGSGEKPCGVCSACYKTERNIHPDLHLYQEDNKNKVDTVRKIKEGVYTLPNDGDYKVYILCRAEEMTREAQNALLKMLEEPPADTVFLLTSRNKTALANTVVSRCVPLSLSPVSEEECIQALLSRETENGCSAEKADQLARQFHGNIGQAIEALTNETYQEEFDRQETVLRAIIAGSEYQLLKALSAYDNKAAKGKEFPALLDALTDAVRDVLILKAGAESLLSSHPQLTARLAEQMTAAQGVRLKNLLVETRGMLQYNVNFSLLLWTFGGKIKTILS